LLEIVESGPIPAVHGVVRWRLIDLAQWVFEEFRISIVSLRCGPPFAARRDKGRFCFYGGDEKCPQVQLWTQV